MEKILIYFDNIKKCKTKTNCAKHCTLKCVNKYRCHEHVTDCHYLPIPLGGPRCPSYICTVR